MRMGRFETPSVILPILFLFLLSLGAVLGSNVKETRDYHEEDWNGVTREDAPVESFEHWFEDAQASLRNKIKARAYQRIEKKAKNVIFFLGDGMGVSTVTAARIYKGQLEGSIYGGEEAQLHMDTFPYVGASKTFCLDRTVADSACSSTAYLCGTKANERTMGVKPEVLFKNCTEQMKPSNHVTSILQWSMEAGKSTGIVTKAKLTDASPGGNYAHIANRDWENDAKVRADGFDPEECSDIAEQLVFDHPGRDINVLLGGGRMHFRSNTTTDFEYNVPNRREDGKDLIKEWKDSKDPARSKYVEDRDGLLGVTAETDDLLGLFAYDGLEWTENESQYNDPSLSEMTEKAIQILSKNPEGFYLFVEGAKIDTAHHANQAKRALTETLEFDKALKLADDLTDDEDTLIIVSADHSHSFYLQAYPIRGNPIFQPANPGVGNDGRPYSMLGYANGPGYEYPTLEEGEDPPCKRYDISLDSARFEDYDYQFRPNVYLDSGTHAGEDVLIQAKGPFAHLLTGVNQQSYIPHVLGYASCVGPFNHFCPKSNTGDGDDNSAAQMRKSPLVLIVFAILSKFLY